VRFQWNFRDAKSLIMHTKGCGTSDEEYLDYAGCRYRILTYDPIGRFGGGSSLAEVRVQEGEPLENALRRFKRKVQQEDIIKEVKRHSFYLKPGERKRVKEALARKRNRKKARKEQD
jgi:small subunit ribosomal protein S21